MSRDQACLLGQQEADRLHQAVDRVLARAIWSAIHGAVPATGSGLRPRSGRGSCPPNDGAASRMSPSADVSRICIHTRRHRIGLGRHRERAGQATSRRRRDGPAPGRRNLEAMESPRNRRCARSPKRCSASGVLAGEGNSEGQWPRASAHPPKVADVLALGLPRDHERDHEISAVLVARSRLKRHHGIAAPSHGTSSTAGMRGPLPLFFSSPSPLRQTQATSAPATGRAAPRSDRDLQDGDHVDAIPPP